jgi:cation diffusion facilitator CzcD-associated flavoprotein CzcO
MERSDLPVAIIGAGPTGLAAAAHLVARGIAPLVLEAGCRVGASVLAWGHVRLFSPWRYCVDAQAAALLRAAGWRAPDPEALPTGRDLVERYLEPLAALPEIAPHLRLGTRVLSVSRLGIDKMKTPGRESAPFVLRVRDAAGAETTLRARAVIDASGTYTGPNPLGASGQPAAGEPAAADRIVYGIPDVLGRDRARYAGRRVAVVGSGHSAFNTLLDLAELAREAPGTSVVWIVRRARTGLLFGGGQADALPARGALGARMGALAASGALRVVSARIGAVRAGADGVDIENEAGEPVARVDQVVAVTGFRPDLALLRELRLALDPAVEAPVAVAPLIDPNLHSCGTVPPHGAVELAHPEPDLYVVGMKSYGRAPTFLLLTGYEQVRSVVAALAGDHEAARRVELVLPETGVCSTDGLAPSRSSSSRSAGARAARRAPRRRPAA